MLSIASSCQHSAQSIGFSCLCHLIDLVDESYENWQMARLNRPENRGGGEFGPTWSADADFAYLLDGWSRAMPTTTADLVVVVCLPGRQFCTVDRETLPFVNESTNQIDGLADATAASAALQCTFRSSSLGVENAIFADIVDSTGHDCELPDWSVTNDLALIIRRNSNESGACTAYISRPSVAPDVCATSGLPDGPTALTTPFFGIQNKWITSWWLISIYRPYLVGFFSQFSTLIDRSRLCSVSPDPDTRKRLPLGIYRLFDFSNSRALLIPSFSLFPSENISFGHFHSSGVTLYL